MTDLDLERLGDVWRQQPDPAELAAIKHAAEVVRRRARWAQAVDIIAALLVCGVVLFLVASNPAPDTVLVGGAAIVLLLIGQVRTRLLRQKELRSLTGTAEQMLDQSIERVTATVKRAHFTLWLMPIGFLLGTSVAYVADHRSGGALRHRMVEQLELRNAIYFLAIVAVVGAMAYTYRAYRRSQRELQRLRSLRDSYRQEGESSLS